MTFHIWNLDKKLFQYVYGKNKIEQWSFLFSRQEFFMFMVTIVIACFILLILVQELKSRYALWM
jgi:hypothetical protein